MISGVPETSASCKIADRLQFINITTAFDQFEVLDCSTNCRKAFSRTDSPFSPAVNHSAACNLVNSKRYQVILKWVVAAYANAILQEYDCLI